MTSKLLDQQRLQAVYAVTIETGIVGQRTALFQGINASFVAGLPSSQEQAAQLLTDLHGLNVHLRDGSVPIRRWLENAILLAGPRAAATVFEASLRDLDPSAPAPTAPRIGADAATCPFPGLAFFDEEMAAFFFGRRTETAEAVARLGDTPQGHRQWLQIEGPSGVGKSSLARAGIVPAIRKDGIDGAPKAWKVAVFQPGTNPIRALAREVRRALGDVEPPPLEVVLQQLQGSPDALRDILRKYVPEAAGFLLVVDQLEEAFTLANPESRAWLATLVARALGDSRSFYLLTTIRSDFVGRFGELPALDALLNDHEKVERYVLKAMSAPGLRASVEGPAGLAGAAWEKGLATRVLKDAEALEGGLPLLAHVLRALWWRGNGRVLSHEAYDELGGIGGALTKSADAIVDGLGKEGREMAKRLLLRLVKIGRGAEDARQPTSRTEVLAAAGGGDDAERVLARLSGGQDRAGVGWARLVRVREEDDAGEPRYDLMHDALLREWGTLQEWLRQGRKGLERRDDVEANARIWEAAHRPANALPQREMLAYLRDAEGLSASGKRFLDAAEKREHWRTWRKRMQTGGLIFATVSFLSILIPNAVSIAREQEAAKRALIGETNRTNATMAAGAVLSYLRSLGDAVHRVAEDENLVRALELGREDQLDQILQRSYALCEDPSQGLKTDDRSPFFLWFVLDTNGVALSYSMGQFDPRFLELKWGSYLYRDYFGGAEALALRNQHQTYVSSGFKSTMNEYYQFAISAPIYGNDQEWKGVLVAAVTTKSKLGSLDMDDGQDIAVLAAPEDPTGLKPGDPPARRPDPPEYVILRHPAFKDGEARRLDNDKVRFLGRESQENEKHVEKWWELPGARWVRSSDDYEDPLGKTHRDATTGAEVAADPRYEGRRQASFAPVGHTGFVVIVRAKQADTLHDEWRLIWQLVKGALLAALPGGLLMCFAFFYDRRQRRRLSRTQGT